MIFDGVFTHAMVNELAEQLTGGRVTKISQPYPNEVILTIRSNRQNYPLLLSANPSYARIQVTQIPFTNPPVPTNFTMTLRKYLEGAKLVEVAQLANDRVVNLTFSTRNDLGDQMPLCLSIEIMGRHSNVILIDVNRQRVIDVIKRIGMDQNRYRTLLPGAAYKQPPAQGKENLFTTTAETYRQLVQMYPNREMLGQALSQTYQGLGKDTALYLADLFHSVADPQQAVAEFIDQVNHPTPLLCKEGSKINFTLFKQEHYWQKFASLSALLDEYYRHKATLDRVQQQGAYLIHTVKNELKKNKRKLKKLQKEFQATENAENFKIKGEVLTTYLYQVKAGSDTITLPNYYANNAPLQIALSKRLSPSQNAQRYFKKYQKLKNAVQHLTEQIRLTQEEIAYLDRILAQIELATPGDLPDIKVELQEQGYIQKDKQAKRKRPHKLSKPERFHASDGTPILVGKNNLQNDRLTLKTARKNHYWLHVKDLPGSHVIVESAEPSEATLVEAATIAAYYSKARLSANIPVDYVRVKNIHKPNGAKPGFVIYTGQKTLFVTPEEKEVLALQN